MLTELNRSMFHYMWYCYPFGKVYACACAGTHLVLTPPWYSLQRSARCWTQSALVVGLAVPLML